MKFQNKNRAFGVMRKTRHAFLSVIVSLFLCTIQVSATQWGAPAGEVSGGKFMNVLKNILLGEESGSITWDENGELNRPIKMHADQYCDMVGTDCFDANATISALGCSEGQLIRYSESTTSWECIDESEVSGGIGTLGCQENEIIKIVGGEWQCVDVTAAGDSDYLRDLGCVDGEIAQMVAGVWNCVDGSAVTSGGWIASTVDINDIHNVNTGDVGIGTDDPQVRLHINVDDSEAEVLVQAYQKAVLSLMTNEGFGRIVYSATGLYIKASDDLTNFVSDLGIFVANDGNVGIGTNTPEEKLVVEGAIRVGDTNTASPTEGTIRWNEVKNDFEGFAAGEWKSLTSGGSNIGGDVSEVISGEVTTTAVAQCEEDAKIIDARVEYSGQTPTMLGDIRVNFTSNPNIAAVDCLGTNCKLHILCASAPDPDAPIINKICAHNQVIKFDSGTNQWECGDDNATDPGTDTLVDLASSCASGQVAKWDGASWVCSNDLDSGGAGSSLWTALGNDIFYNVGKVGIGTDSPNSILHAKTAAGNNAEIDIESGDKGHWGLYHDEITDRLRFWKDGANRFEFTDRGVAYLPGRVERTDFVSNDEVVTKGYVDSAIVQAAGGDGDQTIVNIEGSGVSESFSYGGCYWEHAASCPSNFSQVKTGAWGYCTERIGSTHFYSSPIFADGTSFCDAPGTNWLFNKQATLRLCCRESSAGATAYNFDECGDEKCCMRYGISSDGSITVEEINLNLQCDSSGAQCTNVDGNHICAEGCGGSYTFPSDGTCDGDGDGYVDYTAGGPDMNDDNEDVNPDTGQLEYEGTNHTKSECVNDGGVVTQVAGDPKGTEVCKFSGLCAGGWSDLLWTATQSNTCNGYCSNCSTAQHSWVYNISTETCLYELGNIPSPIFPNGCDGTTVINCYANIVEQGCY